MLAAITFWEIVQLLLLFAVLNIILLAPFMLGGFLSWLEYHQNRRASRR